MKNSNQIILLGILFLATLLSLGGYIYLHAQINKKIASIESTMAEIENEKNSQQNIFGLKRSIELSEDKNTLLDSYFVNQDEVVNFIESLEALAKENAVVIEIDSIQPGNQIGKNGLYVTLDVDGEFNNVNNFILKMENMPYQLNLTKILLATEKSAPKNQTVETQKTASQVTTQSWNASIDLVLISYIK